MIPTLNKTADLHAMTCLLNSLLREWHDYYIYESQNNLYLLIPINDQEKIQLPLLRYSILGRHDYVGNIYLINDEHIKEIIFNELLEKICLKMQGFDTAALSQFKSAVLNSRDNIYHSLQMRKTLEDSHDFLSAEQALLIGHHFHPITKYRDVLSVKDLQIYAPEFKGKFTLQWLFIDKTIIRHIQANKFYEDDWLKTIFIQEFEHIDIPHNMLPIPMHPWQWQYLQSNSVIQDYLLKNQITIVDAEPSELWSATSSLRTLYRDDCLYMLKYSINLKLTNSVRMLLNSEVARGILLHDVLATDKGKEFLSEFPNFHIMTEPAYVCLLDTQNKPMESSMMVCRQNPFVNDTNNQFMLATLTQDHPYGGKNLLLKFIDNASTLQDLSMHSRLKKWFHDYLQLVCKPLVLAYANYGIIMEGHPQNIVLTLQDGFPVAAYFRDCQDHAYSQLGYNLFAHFVPGIKNNPNSVADKQIGCYYFIYQVFLNSTFNVITTLAKSQAIHEGELLDDLYIFLKNINAQDIQDSYCLDVLLQSENLLHKRNFKLALTRANDNQLACSPLEFYTPIVNLILPEKTKHDSKLLYQHYFSTIDKTIGLRKFNLATDINKFFTWQQNPRVEKYWQLNQTYQAVQSYLEKILADPFQEAVIIESNHEAIGYAELYWVNSDIIAQHYEYHDLDRGFHLLIGEDCHLGRKNTKAVFKSIMHYLYLTDRHTQRLVVEPDINNHRFIKYMSILYGWQFMKEVNLPDKKAALFINYRNNFVLEEL